MLPIRASFLVGVAVLTGCGMQVSATFQQSSVASTAADAAAAWFGEVPGWTIVDDPTTAADFEATANASVADLGFARVQAAGTATRDANGRVVSVVAFAVGPDPGRTENELFTAVLEGIRAGVAIDPQPAFDGQAIALRFGERQVIMGPWAGGPYTVFLFVDAPSGGAAEEIYSLLLDAGPGGAPA
jgi:hypothetical protein